MEASYYLELFFYTENSGPTVNSTMTLSLLSKRDEGPNVHFRLSFNVFFGVPSRISCTRGTTTIYTGEGIVLGVNYMRLSDLCIPVAQNN